MSLFALSLLVLLYPALLLADPIPVTAPTLASTHVRQNFLGISLELSYLEAYCELILALCSQYSIWNLVGNDTNPNAQLSGCDTFSCRL